VIKRTPSRPRRIDVEIGSLAVDDPGLARPVEIAAALEYELARLAIGDGLDATAQVPVPKLSATLDHVATAHGVGTAVAQAVARELSR
jgi:hypothetical protein